ncbi:MAG TPA: hypothetical protein VJ859_16325 [Allosphingosinicella sp.]|nr:hypothetical protein [Allosphingosinicella sp.]
MASREVFQSAVMLTERDVCACAWQTILWYGAAGAEAAAEERIAELRRNGLIAGAQMWETVRERIPELLANPDIWDDLPE